MKKFLKQLTGVLIAAEMILSPVAGGLTAVYADETREEQLLSAVDLSQDRDMIFTGDLPADDEEEVTGETEENIEEQDPKTLTVAEESQEPESSSVNEGEQEPENPSVNEGEQEPENPSVTEGEQESENTPATDREPETEELSIETEEKVEIETPAEEVSQKLPIIALKASPTKEAALRAGAGGSGSATAQDMVSRANSYRNKTAASLGISTDTNWCVRFVKKCISDIGMYLGDRECVGEYCREAIDNDRAHLYAIDRRNDVDLKGASKNVSDVSQSSFSPQPGDLICFLWYGYSVYNGNYDHIGVVTEVSGSRLTYVDGNSGSGDYTTVVSHTLGDYRTYDYICAYLRPDYKGTGRAPIGFFDTVDSNNGNVHVTGWAFDPDDPGKVLSVHVYVGGPTNSGAPSFAIPADKRRDDVDQVHGCGAYHGFDETIHVGARGEQPIYVYAIDIGDSPAGNPVLENCPRIVNIKAPSFAVDYSKAFSVDEGETKQFSFTFKGDGIASVDAVIGDGTVASVRADSIDWSQSPVPITVTVRGLKGGTTSFDFQLYDEKGSLLYHKENTINVTAEDPYLSYQTLNKKGSYNVREWLRGVNKSQPTGFSSSDESVLKVNKTTGELQVLKSGSATITVFFGSRKITRKYTVKLPRLSGDTLTIRNGVRKIIKITNYSESAGTYRAKSSNTAVIGTTVTSDGTVAIRSRSKGTAVVTLYIDGVSYGTCTVTVK